MNSLTQGIPKLTYHTIISAWKWKFHHFAGFGCGHFQNGRLQNSAHTFPRWAPAKFLAQYLMKWINHNTLVPFLRSRKLDFPPYYKCLQTNPGLDQRFAYTPSSVLTERWIVYHCNWVYGLRDIAIVIFCERRLWWLSMENIHASGVGEGGGFAQLSYFVTSVSSSTNGIQAIITCVRDLWQMMSLSAVSINMIKQYIHCQFKLCYCILSSIVYV